MAGAGYKLFNTGDVLTAAQVNTYLQEQAVMRFANATARTTALSGVLAEGMVSYLDDTNVVQVYNGSAWVNVGDGGDITAVTAGTGISGGGTSGAVTITNSMATEITAKGDLIVGTGNATFDNLAAGSNGETLVSDSTTTTGLRWQADWNVGKNKILNSDFRLNQRNFSSTTSSGTYGFDRWRLVTGGDGTCTMSAQTFTPGAAPVAGYEARNFLRLVTASQTNSSVFSFPNQLIEDVRTFAGQTVTISFWAKAASGTPKIAIELEQSFGTGGSPSAGVTTYAGQVTISTTWNRYSVTVAIPSISGKTLGTNNDSLLSLNLWISAGSTFNSRTGSLGIQNGTFDFWGVQVEAGSVATPFTTATGTLAGELAACQRYYFKVAGNNNHFFAGFNNSTTEAYSAIPLPVTMRARPTTTVTSASTNLAVRISGGTNVACNGTTSIIGNTTQGLWFSTTVASGLTAGQGSGLINLGSAEAIEMSAEL